MPDLPCHGPATFGWVRTSQPGRCEYCGHPQLVRPEPFGGRDACWPCWAQCAFGEEAGPHTWIMDGTRCGVCGAFKAPPIDESDEGPDDPPDQLDLTPCPLCGAYGPCGWDHEGRALIHAIPADDGET